MKILCEKKRCEKTLWKKQYRLSKYWLQGLVPVGFLKNTGVVVEVKTWTDSCVSSQESVQNIWTDSCEETQIDEDYEIGLGAVHTCANLVDLETISCCNVAPHSFLCSNEFVFPNRRSLFSSTSPPYKNQRRCVFVQSNDSKVFSSYRLNLFSHFQNRHFLQRRPYTNSIFSSRLPYTQTFNRDVFSLSSAFFGNTTPNFVWVKYRSLWRGRVRVDEIRSRTAEQVQEPVL